MSEFPDAVQFRLISLLCSKYFAQDCNLKLVLVITSLGGRFGINCPSAFLEILKFQQTLYIETNIF